MAKAKSARPSWRARVSRIRQRVRTSSGRGVGGVDGGVGEPAVAAEQRDEGAAGGVGVGVVDVGEVGGRPGVEVERERLVAGLEEGPVEEGAVGHQLPSNTGFCFGDEGVVGAGEVFGLHADRLGLGFGFDRLLEAHGPFLVELGLGHHVGEGRAGGDALGERHALRRRASAAEDEAVEEAPGGGFVGGHRAAGVEELGGAALADDARQDGAGAHVAAGEADAGEEEGGLRLRRAEAEVGGHGDDGAGADADAVDGGDDRLAAVRASP